MGKTTTWGIDSMDAGWWKPGMMPFREIFVSEKDDYASSYEYCGNGGKWHPNAVRTGDCGEGCCDDFECPDCGKSFRVEWPD